MGDLRSHVAVSNMNQKTIRLVEGVNANKIPLDKNQVCYGRCCNLQRHHSPIVDKIIEDVVVPNAQKLVPMPWFEYPSDDISMTNSVEEVDFKGMLMAMRDIYFQGADFRDFNQRKTDWENLLKSL
jgi:hypothetical protein